VDDRRATDVRSTNTGMNRTDPQALKKTCSWDSPNSCAMSRKLLDGSCTTAVLTVHSLVGVRTAFGERHSQVP
jgi:hypothetical protein